MAVSSPLSSRQTVAALLTVTAVTGLVDAASYPAPGPGVRGEHDRNVAFFGFTVDPHSGLSAVASVIAIALLAAALGVQNSTVRHLGAADLTTTVLTLTLTGLAADSALVGGPGAKPRRRLGSAAAAFMTAIAHRDTSHAPPRIVISSARKGTPP